MWFGHAGVIIEPKLLESEMVADVRVWYIAPITGAGEMPVAECV